ncbi:hypothetical protein IC619_015690 [Hazenella sp. IB182353]|uniref:hypothetical protein n=1 Tax=Polycladospora coralii TaxID=2771432 RepID=UPI00174648F0|nr:hypothetical protein [Polycladospora coralii]MBS7531915.1 hypothetical protein [Polycladospora coralii]
MHSSILTWKNVCNLILVNRHYCPLAVNDLFSPVITVIPLQLLAYYACLARGYDVDKPV